MQWLIEQPKAMQTAGNTSQTLLVVYGIVLMGRYDGTPMVLLPTGMLPGCSMCCTGVSRVWRGFYITRQRDESCGDTYLNSLITYGIMSFILGVDDITVIKNEEEMILTDRPSIIYTFGAGQIAPTKTVTIDNRMHIWINSALHPA